MPVNPATDKVLIVGRHPHVRSLIRIILTRHLGFPEANINATADTPEEAIAILRTWPAELIITEFDMATDSSGVQLIEMVAAVHPVDDLPYMVLVMSFIETQLGIVESSMGAMALKFGAKDVIGKALTAQGFAEKLREALRLA